MKTLQQLANEALGYMERGTRTDGTCHWYKKDDAPEWINKLCYNAHKVDNVFQDEYIYQFIVYSLNRIINYKEGEEKNIYEALDSAPIEVLYSRDLLDWVGNHLAFARYVDEALVGNKCLTFFEALAAGKCLHKRAIAKDVLDSLVLKQMTLSS